ncbi:sugar transferase [Melioribacter roseus]|nr:sugar transferase [Melioribacter roseus]
MMALYSPLYKIHNKCLKHAIDIVISLLVIIFILPFFYLFIFIYNIIFDRGPVIYKQLRYGYKRIPFYIYKFRTMKYPPKEYDINGKLIQTDNSDERLTALGRFLRNRFLDELPQFVNVLKGEMSIVGPRPHEINHDNEYSGSIENYRLRYTALPGITGLAQVNGLHGAVKGHGKMAERLELDLYYIENWSLHLDIKIMIKTGRMMMGVRG